MAKPPPADARRKLDRLRALNGDLRQGEYAAELFPGETNLDVLLSVLGALALHPRPELRPALLERFRKFAEAGPKRDPGGMVRAGILRALRDIALPDDAPILLGAARTYEHTFNERGGPVMVRAAALIALFNTDQDAARYRAIEILGELPLASRDNGEPAITALRILGEAEAFDALLLFALTAGDAIAELTGECLKQLARAPDTALQSVITRYLGDSRDMVQLGLADLLVDHPTSRFIPQFSGLLDGAQLDVLRYAVTSAVVSRRADLVTPVAEAAARCSSRARMAVFEEGLALAHVPELLSALERLRERMASTPAQASADLEEHSAAPGRGFADGDGQDD
jgi:hypothetical protein